MSKTVHFLLSREFPRNELAFLYPVGLHKEALAENRFNIDFFRSCAPELLDCDVLVVSSKFAKEMGWWRSGKKNEMFEFLVRAKRHTDCLIWGDLGDSTGATHFEVLPYVDKYWKGSVLKNKERYLQKFYGSRLFTDFYHNHFGIEDTDSGEPHLNFIPEREELRKVYVSWNQAFLNYSYFGFLYDGLKRRIWKLPFAQLTRFTPPSKNRSIAISCRVSRSYARNTIAFQRARILDQLDGMAATEKVSRHEYYRELENTKIVVSPFGWGEICYRDFEAIVAGAVLVKPDCTHLETWPDIFQKNRTYLPFEWDLSDFRDAVNGILHRPEQWRTLASNAQQQLQHFVFSEHASQEFCKRFAQITQSQPLDQMEYADGFA